MLDLDSWQCDTETQLERLILNAELVLSQEKTRQHIGLLSTADTFDQLDDREQREVRDLIAQAKKLEHGVGRELDDIQRSVAEEKEDTTLKAATGSDTLSVHSSGTLQRVREMSEYIALLEAKVDDLQLDIDAHKPALALSTVERAAKQQLKTQLDDERRRYEQLEDELQRLQQQLRDERQSSAVLAQQLSDVSGSYEGSEALLAEEKQRSQRWLKEKEEVKADKRQLEDDMRRSHTRQVIVQNECERRQQQYETGKRDSVRMKVMGVVSVGLVVVWAGLERWLTEYVRSQPQLYTF